MALCFRTHHLGTLQSEQRHVVTCHLAETWVALHIHSTAKQRCEEREIDAKPTREVCHRRRRRSVANAHTHQPRCHRSLIARRSLRRTLLHRQVWRIDKPLTLSPLRQLAARRLPPCYLLKSEREVEGGVARRPQRKCAHVVGAVKTYKLLHVSSKHRLCSGGG